ncbi:MAG TPA: twin-arginine translocase subunit TatC [Promineifilum sp.]|nr:twin-arginine translocase subunit TatC [Promineifilum sp.]HQF69799.1 twin-arginine translocase subunit TatC [Promineifilum sp.]
MTTDERRDRNRPDAEGPVMSILDHLNELRVHVMRAGIAVLVTTIFSFIFAERLLAFLLQPYAQSRPAGATLQTLRPTEGIETYFRVALLAGIILAMPIILLELWRFIQPGLSRQERRYVYIFIPAGLALFLLGIAFAWYVLAPTAIYFLANFMTEVFATEWTGDEYIGFITRLLLWIGLGFQMPIVIYFIARLGLLTARTMREQWRVAVVVIAILAAVITPSIDPVTMLLTMAPLLALYVLSIGLAVLGQRQFERSAEASEVPISTA